VLLFVNMLFVQVLEVPLYPSNLTTLSCAPCNSALVLQEGVMSSRIIIKVKNTKINFISIMHAGIILVYFPLFLPVEFVQFVSPSVPMTLCIL